MSSNGPVLPDYRGPNLVGVVAGLMASPGQRLAWIPAAAADAEQIVLFLLDGLGWLQMRERLGLLPNLAALEGGPITTVAPSTTASALTSVAVGAPPAAHGVVGYKVAITGPEGPEVMNVLKWSGRHGDLRPHIDPARFQLLEPFGGHPVPVVSRADFAGTGFTDAHQRGSRQVGWHQPSGLAVDVARLIAEGERFVYAYYDGIDRVAHAQGFGPYYDAEAVAVDRLVGDLLDALPPSAALVVTADHGQVEVGPNVEELDQRIMERVVLVSGEPRFRWLHTEDGSEDSAQALAAVARDLYGDQAWVHTFSEIDGQGWLGGPLSPAMRSRLGDVAIVASAPVAYMEPADGRGPESRLVCRHGSLTEAEMFVPLVASRGRG